MLRYLNKIKETFEKVAECKLGIKFHSVELIHVEGSKETLLFWKHLYVCLIYPLKAGATTYPLKVESRGYYIYRVTKWNSINIHQPVEVMK